MAGSLSYSSSCLSASEFFDAEDNQSKCEDAEKKDNTGDNTESSSENNSLSSEEGEENSMSSENSEVGTEYSLTKGSKMSCWFYSIRSKMGKIKMFFSFGANGIRYRKEDKTSSSKA